MSSVIHRSRTHLLSRSYASSFASQSRLSFFFSHLRFFSTSRGAPLSVYDFLTQKHQFSHQAASRIALVLTHLKKPENSDSNISFLKESGFSKAQLEKIFSARPFLLPSSTDKVIKPKIKIFEDFGLSKSEIACMISRWPTILNCSANNKVLPSLAVLKSLLGTKAEVAKLLKVSGAGWCLSTNLEKTLIPNVEFLESCGIPKKKIINYIYYFPTFLLHKPELLRKYVDKVVEMGIPRGSNSFIYAVRVVRSLSNVGWERKLKAFRNLGFSEADISKVFRTSSPVFATSVRKMKMNKEVLLATGKYDLSCIVKYPVSLMYSIEKRYKPRLQVLGILEKKKLVKNWPSLPTLCTMTNAEFFEKYVAPYMSDLAEVYKQIPLL